MSLTRDAANEELTFQSSLPVLGEFTISSVLLFETLPTWLVKISGEHAQESVAVSVASLLFAWLLLLLVSLADRRRGGDPLTAALDPAEAHWTTIAAKETTP